MLHRGKKGFLCFTFIRKRLLFYGRLDLITYILEHIVSLRKAFDKVILVLDHAKEISNDCVLGVGVNNH